MKESMSVAQMRRRRAVLARRMARHGQLMRGSVSMRSTQPRREGEAPVARRWQGPYLYIVVTYKGGGQGSLPS